MSCTIELREIAHARAGDKGNRSNVAVFAHCPDDYAIIVDQVTPERVKSAFGHMLHGPVTRYTLPTLNGINLVMDEALGGGVNESLNLDSHGKSWSFMILSLTVEVSDAVARRLGQPTSPEAGP